MPWTEIGFERNGQRRFLHTFVKLKQMWMTLPDANPDNFRRTFGRKGSDTFNREEERAEFDSAQFLAQGKLDISRHVGKKSEREMHLTARNPANAMDARVKIDKCLFDRRRQID